MMWWDVSGPRSPTGLLFILQVIYGHGEPRWWWCQLGKTPDSSTSALWQSYQQRHLGASRRNRRRSENFACRQLRCVNGFLTCRKILRHGTSGFISHPKEGVLRIFIALKIPSPRLGFNPQPLGPVASTLYHRPEKHVVILVMESGLRNGKL
jgi:hypothetical protein